MASSEDSYEARRAARQKRREEMEGNSKQEPIKSNVTETSTKTETKVDDFEARRQERERRRQTLHVEQKTVETSKGFFFFFSFF